MALLAEYFGADEMMFMPVNPDTLRKIHAFA
jgi:hypothetical protein